MQLYDIGRTQYKVSDFLSWQRSGGLELQPVFQRRSVWKPGARSFLLDTVVRGLPIPIVFVRERIDLESLENVREVVDGQQRLRTLLAYVEPAAIPDYDPELDAVTLRRAHNPELAGRTFDQLGKQYRHRILNYAISTHVLPSTVDDREILMIFSRLNSTGTQLNKQELRNAAWFGEFKTVMYSLALEQLDRWRRWRVLGTEEISRMKEVELTSDLVVMLLNGYGGKSQAAIDKAYEKYDNEFPLADSVSRRFRRVFDAIEELLESEIADTPFRTENWFVPLFFVLHGKLWPKAPIRKDVGPQRPPPGLKAGLSKAAKTLAKTDRLPQEVRDAITGAATDAARRQTRLDYLAKIVG